MPPQFDGTTGLLIGIGVEKVAIAILTLIILIIAIAFIWSFVKGRQSTLYYDDRGLPRCRKCQDSGRNRSKVIYFKEQEARQEAHRQTNRYGKTMYAYESRRCGYWHLSSQSPRSQERATTGNRRP